MVVPASLCVMKRRMSGDAKVRALNALPSRVSPDRIDIIRLNAARLDSARLDMAPSLKEGRNNAKPHR